MAVVVLPAPDGPTRATSSPGSAVKLISRSTGPAGRWPSLLVDPGATAGCPAGRAPAAVSATRCCGSGCASPLEPAGRPNCPDDLRSEEHTSELQSRPHLVCRLLLEK